MTLKIAFFNPNGDAQEFHDALRPYPDIDLAVAPDMAALPVALEGAQVLIITNRVYTPEPAKLVRDHGSDLRWIAFTTSGIDKAVASGLPKGVTVTNMSGLKAWQVAEHALYLMLGLVRKMRVADARQRNGDWARNPLSPLMDNISHKHLVIVGTGAIGQDIARKAKAFDMRVTGISRSSKPPPFFDAMRPRSELVAAAAEADVLMVAALAEADTFGLISRDVIAAMHSGSYIVNIARGSLIDETALVEALQSGAIAGAGLDVQAMEPTPPESPLWNLENVILTPHLAGSGSAGDGATHSSLFVENLLRWRANQSLEKIVAQT